jgi:predicted DNA-binding transcriptional regulator AlpA
LPDDAAYRESGVSHAEENHHHTPSAQVAVAKKASALKAEAEERVAAVRQAQLAANDAYRAEAALAADRGCHQHDKHHVHGARAPPVRLLDKNDILEITNVTFPTIWAWMRAGTFPRSRVVGGKSMWLSSEIEQWLAALPVRPLKGDTENTGAAA